MGNNNRSLSLSIMGNNNRLKQKISRLLRSSSCGSCNSRTTSDVVARPETRHRYQLIDLFSPNPHQFPSNSISTHKTELSPFPKVPFPSPLLTPQHPKGPPASPISPLITFPKTKKPKKKRNKPTQLLNRANSDNYYDDSELGFDDDENTTLFSSVPLSSNSSDSFRRNREVDGLVRRECEMGLAPFQGKVRASLVVKKRSSDPYDDFRNSMVEMIVERRIFGARELEDLLEAFLALNSYHHHGVIVQVFTEIWNALFCKSS